MWPFQKKAQELPITITIQDILDRIQALERGERRVHDDLEDFRGLMDKRFGRLWARLRGSKSDDPEEEKVEEAPPPKKVPMGRMRRLRGF